MVTTVFPSIAAGFDATAKGISLTVFVGDQQTDCVAASCSHGVDQPIGTATLTLPLPLPAWIDLAVEVQVIAGYPGATATIFSGRVAADEGAIDERGMDATIRCEGWASLLAEPPAEDRAFDGPITLKELFRAFCAERGVPLYLADETTYPDGTTPLELGGNADIDAGQVIVKATQSPLQELTRWARLFGYRVFDTPAGPVRLRRVSGLPTADALLTIREGVNAYRFGRRTLLGRMVNVWEVTGARYTDADGEQVELSSVTSPLPDDPRLQPLGYVKDSISDQALVSQALADAARDVAELDRGEPEERETWECDLRPDLQPGDVVELVSTSLDVDGNRWLMSIDQSVGEQGAYASMEAWAGGLDAIATSTDCTTLSLLGTEGRHVGDESIAWYKRPTPDGMSVALAFTAPDDVTSMTLSGKAHGCNSFFVGGGNSGSSGSRVEVWQGGVKLASALLPVLDENFAARLDYTLDANWTAFSVALPGSIAAGTAELRIVGGVNALATAGPTDDFEVKDLTLTFCGVGTPETPGAPDPWTPTPPRAS